MRNIKTTITVADIEDKTETQIIDDQFVVNILNDLHIFMIPLLIQLHSTVERRDKIRFIDSGHNVPMSHCVVLIKEIYDLMFELEQEEHNTKKTHH